MAEKSPPPPAPPRACRRSPDRPGRLRQDRRRQHDAGRRSRHPHAARRRHPHCRHHQTIRRTSAASPSRPPKARRTKPTTSPKRSTARSRHSSSTAKPPKPPRSRKSPGQVPSTPARRRSSPAWVIERGWKYVAEQASKAWDFMKGLAARMPTRWQPRATLLKKRQDAASMPGYDPYGRAGRSAEVAQAERIVKQLEAEGRRAPRPQPRPHGKTNKTRPASPWRQSATNT